MKCEWLLDACLSKPPTFGYVALVGRHRDDHQRDEEENRVHCSLHNLSTTIAKCMNKVIYGVFIYSRQWVTYLYLSK